MSASIFRSLEEQAALQHAAAQARLAAEAQRHWRIYTHHHEFDLFRGSDGVWRSPEDSRAAALSKGRPS